MIENGKILIGKGEQPGYLLPQMANRHGLIAGATGTGKTTTLKVIAEGFSSLGVPVFLADIKGDLVSLCQSGAPNEKLNERLQAMSIEGFEYKAFPVQCWDVFGQNGHPVRATISEMGPLLLSRLLGLNDTQRGVLSIAFKIADDNNLLLLDMKDLKAILKYVGDNAKEFSTEYGYMTKQSVGAIQRSLAVLEEQGASDFFGEPAIDIWDWIKTDANGQGYINVLDATKLYQSPDLYATMLLFMLNELFEKLPEVGDLPRPKIVFFFDEAHLLFDGASKALEDKIEQVVRLVRSKGVGVYFISQSPMDLPNGVLAQLSNRVQHALRAYTPADQKVIKATSDTFRTNPAFKVEDVITQLATGEALMSTLDEKGVPGIVEKVMVVPPQSLLGTASDDTRRQVIQQSPIMGKYEQSVDRESAYELLQKKYQDDAATAQAAAQQAEQNKQAAALKQQQEKEAAALLKKQQAEAAKQAAAEQKAAEKAREQTAKMVDKMALGALNSIGKEIARNTKNPLIRGILGSLTRR